ncbi:hypothetical protein K503DRAFT_766528 [Rhizopogon vinicolor AM-OR11-026]|uniref:RecA family profile 2 domain-containing protein n=1 Tax=Rhizopogon vinicolor AM-OR11-026 TaxID=1314800 RepID=A0A1B7NCT1_9AGAM|nr:hypothetical protein K503DRAFT_766528 [Rhizopogon vinicolor AM-OR11-026]
MTFVAGGALKPIGGHILSHSSATRMFLRKGKSLTLPQVIVLSTGRECPRPKANICTNTVYLIPRTG